MTLVTDSPRGKSGPPLVACQGFEWIGMLLQLLELGSNQQITECGPLREYRSARSAALASLLIREYAGDGVVKIAKLFVRMLCKCFCRKSAIVAIFFERVYSLLRGLD